MRLTVKLHSESTDLQSLAEGLEDLSEQIFDISLVPEEKRPNTGRVLTHEDEEIGTWTLEA